MAPVLGSSGANPKPKKEELLWNFLHFAGIDAAAGNSSERPRCLSIIEMPDDSPDSGGDDTPPDSASAPPPPGGPPPGGGPPGGSPGGGTLPPQGAAAAQQPSALGQEAMGRGAVKLMVHALHTRIYPMFQLNSPEGKAIHKALSALAPVFGSGGDDDKDKNGAQAALMQRAMAARQGAGGPPGQQPGMQQPNRGPIPSMTGGGGQ